MVRSVIARWAVAPVVVLVLAVAAPATARTRTPAPLPYRVVRGVILPSELRRSLHRLAARYQRRTGRRLVVTSGYRSPRRQACAMYAKIRRGRRILRLYRHTRLAREVLRGYRRARRKRLGREATLAAMARIFSAQAKRGEYLSAHLRRGAVDIRSRGMSRRQRRIFLHLARNTPGILLVLHERHPPHFHLEFRVARRASF